MASIVTASFHVFKCYLRAVLGLHQHWEVSESHFLYTLCLHTRTASPVISIPERNICHSRWTDSGISHIVHETHVPCPSHGGPACLHPRLLLQPQLAAASPWLTAHRAHWPLSVPKMARVFATVGQLCAHTPTTSCACVPSVQAFEDCPVIFLGPGDMGQVWGTTTGHFTCAFLSPRQDLRPFAIASWVLTQEEFFHLTPVSSGCGCGLQNCLVALSCHLAVFLSASVSGQDWWRAGGSVHLSLAA